MAWVKGQSGNPAGPKPGSRSKDNSVDAIIKRGSKAGLKLLCDVIDARKGKDDNVIAPASMGERLKASQYMIDRDLGRVAQQDTAMGMFHGATIQVNTGFSDTPRLSAPDVVEHVAQPLDMSHSVSHNGAPVSHSIDQAKRAASVSFQPVTDRGNKE